MDDRKVSIVFDYDYDMVVGYATIKEDGTVHMTLTDPRIVEAIKADREKIIAGLSISKAPAVSAPWTGMTVQRNIPTGDFREKTCANCVHSRQVISDDEISVPLLKCFRFPPMMFNNEEGEVCQGNPDANDTCGEFKEADLYQ